MKKLIMVALLASILSCLIVRQSNSQSGEMSPCSGKIFGPGTILCQESSAACAISEVTDPQTGNPYYVCSGIIYTGEQIIYCKTPSTPNPSANCRAASTLQVCATKNRCKYQFIPTVTPPHQCVQGDVLQPSKTPRVFEPDEACLVEVDL